ncbi:uncharacterized protein LOC112549935 [Alligator sinensis]|uniref:Uncharacterized protein LOC112549935 n=1 Tax=Alligator sinensis TaxID=38654 RepID=A0A3Q0GGY0_ALLSI|nr:uncharacterized protein LOC112549935 [Alligator sinensis]XP_025057418.1 uncharacterized protein LOC112549935 [Alligator sinensis]
MCMTGCPAQQASINLFSEGEGADQGPHIEGRSRAEAGDGVNGAPAGPDGGIIKAQAVHPRVRGGPATVCTLAEARGGTCFLICAQGGGSCCCMLVLWALLLVQLPGELHNAKCFPLPGGQGAQHSPVAAGHTWHHASPKAAALAARPRAPGTEAAVSAPHRSGECMCPLGPRHPSMSRPGFNCPTTWPGWGPIHSCPCPTPSLTSGASICPATALPPQTYPLGRRGGVHTYACAQSPQISFSPSTYGLPPTLSTSGLFPRKWGSREQPKELNKELRRPWDERQCMSIVQWRGGARNPKEATCSSAWETAVCHTAL